MFNGDELALDCLHRQSLPAIVSSKISLRGLSQIGDPWLRNPFAPMNKSEFAQEVQKWSVTGIALVGQIIRKV
ncbi:hypothetical protein BPTFM16_00098 [Altererythrobacter insulae]|nr:hypothetical protein BPTFM16_00098 [Altererythrobacter insulae]